MKFRASHRYREVIMNTWILFGSCINFVHICLDHSLLQLSFVFVLGFPRRLFLRVSKGFVTFCSLTIHLSSESIRLLQYDAAVFLSRNAMIRLKCWLWSALLFDSSETIQIKDWTFLDVQLQTKATDTVLSCSVVRYVLCNLVLTFESAGGILTVKIQMKQLKLRSSTFLWWRWLCCITEVVLTFESVGEIMKCDHSNKSYWAVFSSGVVQRGSNFSVRRWNWDGYNFKNYVGPCLRYYCLTNPTGFRSSNCCL